MSSEFLLTDATAKEPKRCTPSISVVIPTKDRPSLLLRAVISALAYDEGEIEVVVVDDHSAIPARKALSKISDVRLKIIEMQSGRTGVSAARNYGLDHASGQILMFLDDDDEFVEGYLQLVASLDLDQFDFGCAAYSKTRGMRSISVNRRFANGPIPVSAPIRKQFFGFGMGFWMTRRCMEILGPIDERLVINEDTDYFCRLRREGMVGWYSSFLGVSVHTYNSPKNLGSISHRVCATERARCMRIVSDRYPELRSHLGARYIDHVVKSRVWPEAWKYAAEQHDFLIRLRLRSRILIKSFGYLLKRKLKPGST